MRRSRRKSLAHCFRSTGFHGRKMDPVDIIIDALETDNVDLFCEVLLEYQSVARKLYPDEVLLHWAAYLGRRNMVRVLHERMPEAKWKLDKGASLYDESAMDLIRTVSSEMTKEAIVTALGERVGTEGKQRRM